MVGDFRDIASQLINKLAHDVDNKKMQLISETFEKITGEKLTPENYSRVTVDYRGRGMIHSSIFTHEDVYCIDGVPALAIYPINFDSSINEAYKATCNFKYRHL